MFTMGKSCCAADCEERVKKGRGISFYRFPAEDSAKRNKWITAERRVDWEPRKSTQICAFCTGNTK